MDLQEFRVDTSFATIEGAVGGNGKPPGDAPEEHAALLRQVRDGLADIATSKADLGEQAQVMRERLFQLSALADAAADAGLSAEVQEVGAYRESAGRDLAEIVRRLESVVEVEQRLRVAERRLMAQDTVPSALPA